MKVRYLKKSKALFKLILLSTMHGHARSIRNQITLIVNRTSFDTCQDRGAVSMINFYSYGYSRAQSSSNQLIFIKWSHPTSI